MPGYTTTDQAKDAARRFMRYSWESKAMCEVAEQQMQNVRASLAGRLHMYKGNKMAREMIHTSFDMSGLICTVMGDYYNAYDNLSEQDRKQVAILMVAAMEKLDATTNVPLIKATVEYAVKQATQIIGTQIDIEDEDTMDAGTNLGQGGK